MSIDHKLDLEALNGICPSGYFYSIPCIWDPKDGRKPVEGTGYLMCGKLTDQQKELLRRYSNVVLSVVHYKYAPEIKHDAVFIGNHVKGE